MPFSFLCDQLVYQQHISLLFVRTTAAAALRKSAKSTQLVSQLRTSHRRWAASEHEQQPPASSLTLPQQQDDQVGLQTQSTTSPPDQTHGAQVQYQPSGNDQASSNSTTIVDAQLTPPISSDDDAQTQDASHDDDAPMPEAPAAHDIATPRRQIGGRCRKWCISTKQASDKRQYAACCMCGQQFSHGEARLQQWCNRNTHCAYVHAQCVNGRVAHDHELLPKQSTDQGAVETVIRQRDCVIRASARTRIKPPLRHPLMMIRTCSVVKRLFA